jgi:hypothetical protein
LAAPEFTPLDPLSTFETSALAEEMTEKLKNEHPDLLALYISGGGISGAINAPRTCGKAGKIMAVGYEFMDNTRPREEGCRNPFANSAFHVNSLFCPSEWCRKRNRLQTA